MLRWLQQVFGKTWAEGEADDASADRRKYERFDVKAPLEILVDGAAYPCTIDNVSAGGVRVIPVTKAKEGTSVTVRDPASGMELTGLVVGHDGQGTRVKFDSEDAGIIVSVWLRMANEE